MPLALITGASTGIGRATAVRLAQSGWTVLAGVRDLAVAEGLGDGIIPLTLDVTDGEHIAAAAVAVREHSGETDGSGSLNALVNNAGVGFGGPLEIISSEDMLRQFEVNVFAQVAVTQALLPALRRAAGRIVLISSIGGRVATPYLGPYAASKHALEAIGDALRVELRSSGVQVTLIEPGSVATPIWDKGRTQAQQVSIPPALSEYYGHVPAAMEKTLEDTARRAVPPERVAETIAGALGARRMRARYLVGRDAKGALLARRLLPDRVFDRVIQRTLGV
jgi:NAD(P)-dependent dehydrogenase (short-subunit alcohol dehydrogenase family)